MGRKFIKGVLDSAHGYKSMDMSDEAKRARKIENYHALNGLVFVAKISISQNSEGERRNEIKYAITPEYAAYNQLMFPDQVMPSTNLFNDSTKIPLQRVSFDEDANKPTIDDEIPF